MEEVLQRVQFKFASIIGELCSEPLVLSRFAVWVDMRLSEYKLKGSISLDCSGETPDPIWLKGITYALMQKLKQAQKEATNNLSVGKGFGPDRVRRPRAGGGQQSLTKSSVGSDNLGPLDSSFTGVPQDIILKEEPGDDNEVYPVDLYTNQEKTTNSSVGGVKRRLPSSTISNFQSNNTSSDISEPMHKISRLTSAEPLSAGVEPENTSLLSIIGLDNSADGSSELTLQEADSDDISIILDSSSLQDLGSVSQVDNNSTSFSQPVLQKNIGHGMVRRKTGKIKYRSQVPATVAKTRGHVTMFQNWLRNQPSPELRRIEDIPPAQLDMYLAAFFRTIKRHTGDDYNPSSFKSLRLSLERHLRDMDYPYSITRSEEFFVSKQAYKERMRSFKENNSQLPSQSDKDT